MRLSANRGNLNSVCLSAPTSWHAVQRLNRILAGLSNMCRPPESATDSRQYGLPAEKYLGGPGIRDVKDGSWDKLSLRRQ
jgi:hypothetical protein